MSLTALPARPPGRPTKFTPDRCLRIVAALKAGNYIGTAARLGGVSEDAMAVWLRKGEAEEEGPYRDFFEAVQEAMAHAEARAVTKIIAAGDQQWQALAWWLERTRPAKFGRKDRVQMEHQGNITAGKDDDSIHAAILEATSVFRELAEGTRERNILRATVSTDDLEQPMDTEYIEAPDAETSPLPTQ